MNKKEYRKQLISEYLSNNPEPKINPMVILKGIKEGQKCKTCKFLVSKRRTRIYYKCQKRSMTNGAATDVRINWDACGLYQEIEG